MRKSFFIALLLLVSCDTSKQEIPEGIIPHDTMARVLIQIHLAESKVSNKNLTPDSSLMYYQLLKKDIYHKFRIDEKRFEKSINYYSQNVKEMDKIYEEVVDSLGLKESRGKLE